MKDIIQSGSVLLQLQSMRNVTLISVALLIFMLLIALASIFNVKISVLLTKIVRTVVVRIGKAINKREQRYYRDLYIGKINEKQNKVKLYRFLNNLIIDLGLKRQGATPYEFLFIVVVASAIITLVFCQLVFGGILIAIPIFPIMLVAIMAMLYTKSNIAHDMRIEAIIESENIIANNIKDGVVVAVRNSIDAIPQLVRSEFKEFLDNIEHKNYHIKAALQELNNNLGSTSNDFISNCIIFETDEQYGHSKVFQDLVDVNNTKTELRNEMKKEFEAVSTEFVVSAVMIFAFLSGVIAIFPVVANFYFNNPIGQIVIVLDILALVTEFVLITYLRAKEI